MGMLMHVRLLHSRTSGPSRWQSRRAICFQFSHTHSSVWLIILAPIQRDVNAYRYSRAARAPLTEGRSQRGSGAAHPGEGKGLLRGGNALEDLTRIGAIRHIEEGT